MVWNVLQLLLLLSLLSEFENQILNIRGLDFENKELWTHLPKNVRSSFVLMNLDR